MRLTLTPRQRDIVHARCAEGKTIKEVARDLGISYETIRQYSNDLRKRNGIESVNRVCFEYGREQATKERAS